MEKVPLLPETDGAAEAVNSPTPRHLQITGQQQGAARCVSLPWLIKLFQQLEDITS